MNLRTPINSLWSFNKKFLNLFLFFSYPFRHLSSHTIAVVYGRWDQVQALRKMPTNRMN